MTVFLSSLILLIFFEDHNGNKFYNFLCYPRLFRQYVHVIFIIIYIYMSVLTMFLLLYTYCTILPNKSNQKKNVSNINYNILLKFKLII